MKKAIIIIIAILVIIQFFRIDKTNPPADMEKDFITITIIKMSLLKRSSRIFLTM